MDKIVLIQFWQKTWLEQMNLFDKFFFERDNQCYMNELWDAKMNSSILCNKDS